MAFRMEMLAACPIQAIHVAQWKGHTSHPVMHFGEWRQPCRGQRPYLRAVTLQAGVTSLGAQVGDALRRTGHPALEASSRRQVRHPRQRIQFLAQGSTSVPCDGPSQGDQGSSGDGPSTRNQEPTILSVDRTRSMFRCVAASLLLSLALLASPGELGDPIIMHPGQTEETEETSRSLLSSRGTGNVQWQASALQVLGLRLPSAHAGVLASLKSSKTFDKVVMALGGPMVTSDTVSNMLETEPEEGNLAGSIVDDLVASVTEWFADLQLMGEGETAVTVASTGVKGFFERLAAMELSALGAQAQRWALFTPIVAGAMWWQMQGQRLFKPSPPGSSESVLAPAPRQGGASAASLPFIFRRNTDAAITGAGERQSGAFTGAGGASAGPDSFSDPSKTLRVRTELRRLQLQAQLRSILEQKGVLGAGQVPVASLSARDEPLETIMQELIDMGPRPDSSGYGEQEQVLSLQGSDGDLGVIQGTEGLRKLTPPDSLEGSWELVHVARAYQGPQAGEAGAYEGVDADVGPAGNGAAGAARVGSAAGVPELLLEQLQQTVAVLPGAELAGLVHQDVQVQARKPWTVSSNSTGAGILPPQGITLGTPDNSLWASSSASIRLGPLGTVKFTLGSRWGNGGGSRGGGTSGGEGDGEDWGCYSPYEGAGAVGAGGDVIIETVTVQPTELLGSKVTPPPVPLPVPPFVPLTVRLPEMLRPTGGGPVVVVYIDDQLRIDCDSAGNCFLFIRK